MAKVKKALSIFEKSEVEADLIIEAEDLSGEGAEPLSWEDGNFDAESPMSWWPTLSKSNYDFILISSKHAKALLPYFKKTPNRIVEIKTFDILIREHGEFWPHSILRDSIHMTIAEKYSALDTSSTVYITGLGAKARVAISVAVQMGFETVRIVTSTVSKSEVQELQRKYFGVRFELLDSGALTIQTNDGSMLVNTLDLANNQIVSEDMSYLNFLKSNSLILDFNPVNVESALKTEASNLGIDYISSAMIKDSYRRSLMQKVSSLKD